MSFPLNFLEVLGLLALTVMITVFVPGTMYLVRNLHDFAGYGAPAYFAMLIGAVGVSISSSGLLFFQLRKLSRATKNKAR